MSLRRENVAVLLGLATGLIGAAISFYCPESDAFQRSGSVIVCIAVGFGLRDLKDSYEAKFREFASEQEESRVQNDIVFGDEELEAQVRGTTDQRLGVAKAVAEKLGSNAVTIDATILISGTLIWGFGDLLF